MILAEIFNSWQGEGGSLEGSAFGRRQIFVRFAGCDLRCTWCDSKAFIFAPSVKKWRYEVEPFTGRFEYKPNPAKLDEVVDVIERLYYYMVKDRSWIMRVDATLYNDNRLNNGCLMFQYLSEKRLEEFIDIFRNRNINYNYDGSSGFKHIKIEFTK